MLKPPPPASLSWQHRANERPFLGSRGNAAVQIKLLALLPCEIKSQNLSRRDRHGSKTRFTQNAAGR